LGENSLVAPRLVAGNAERSRIKSESSRRSERAEGGRLIPTRHMKTVSFVSCARAIALKETASRVTRSLILASADNGRPRRRVPSKDDRRHFGLQVQSRVRGGKPQALERDADADIVHGRCGGLSAFRRMCAAVKIAGKRSSWMRGAIVPNM